MDDGDGGVGGASSSSGDDSGGSEASSGVHASDGDYGGADNAGASDNAASTAAASATDETGGNVAAGTYANAFAGTDPSAVAASWNAAMSAAAAAPDGIQAKPAVADEDDAVALATPQQIQNAVLTDQDSVAVDQVAATTTPPNAQMTLSPEGMAALYDREAQPGVSLHTHWPGGASGVTLGPGYDMSGRTADQISSDLQGIGVPATTADTLAQGAGLTGAAAQAFAAAHRNDVSLTDAQQSSLLSQTVPSYQSAVQQDTTTPLTQHQFDAMVSYAYNRGVGGFESSGVLGLVNSGRLDAVPAELNRANPPGGLTNRRAGEANQFAH